jgi:hypothetical protein
MIVSEVLKLLADLPPDAQVMVWQDGERLAIDSADWWTDDCVDFNVKGDSNE